MVLSLIISSLLVAAVSLVVARIATCKLALAKFQELSRGLPIVPGASLLGNHADIFIASRNCEKLQESHRTMGKTVGFIKSTEFCVSTVDLDFIKIFALDQPGHHLVKFNQVGMPGFRAIDNSIGVLGMPKWRPVRKAVALALAPNKFKTPNVQQEIEDSIEKLIGLIELRLKSGEPDSDIFVADDILFRYSVQLIFKCLYKRDDQVDFEAKHDEGIEQLEEGFRWVVDNFLVVLVSIFPLFWALIDWLALRYTSLGRIVRRFESFIDEQMRLRRAAYEQWPELKRAAEAKGYKLDPHDFTLRDGTRFRRNMADHLADQFERAKLSRQDLADTSIFLVGAGNRTASDCLIHTSYLLSINQNVQEKLRASILSEGIESEYLEWVLLESLRLLPPVPLGCSRTLSRDIELASGHIVPKGTFVLTNAYAIHRLKEYWGEDADEFRPERWRDTSKHHPMQFLGFGAGHRVCPGRQFAMHEMKMVLAALLARYRLTGWPRDDVYKFSSPIFTVVVPESPTLIRIRPVENS